MYLTAYIDKYILLLPNLPTYKRLNDPNLA